MFTHSKIVAERTLIQIWKAVYIPWMNLYSLFCAWFLFFMYGPPSAWIMCFTCRALVNLIILRKDWRFSYFEWHGYLGPFFSRNFIWIWLCDPRSFIVHRTSNCNSFMNCVKSSPHWVLIECKITQSSICFYRKYFIICWISSWVYWL